MKQRTRLLAAVAVLGDCGYRSTTRVERMLNAPFTQSPATLLGTIFATNSQEIKEEEREIGSLARLGTYQ